MIDFLIDLLGEELLREEGVLINGTPTFKLIDIAKKHKLKISYANISKDNLDMLADSVLSLDFPSTKSGGTVAFKPNKSDLKSKLEAFFKKYDYQLEIVEDRLKKYINKCYYNPSEYNQALKYYIMKDGYSALADDCENEVEEQIKSLNGFILL